MSDIDFEREHALGESVTAKPGRNSANRLLGALFLSLGVGVVGYAWYSMHFSAGVVKPGNEDFNTAKVADGQFNFKPLPPPKTDNRLVLPPVPMPTPSPAEAPVVVTAAPVIDTGDMERKAEEERLRKEAEAREAARIRSAMLVVDAAPTAGAASVGTAGQGAVKVIAPDDNPNSRFLASVGSADVETSHAVKIDRIDALVPQGTMIRGVLETAIQSDLPGMVRATTSEDVYSFDGRRILIPKSTMLTGEYRAGLATGQTRVFIVWTRMLRADGVSLVLWIGRHGYARARRADGRRRRSLFRAVRRGHPAQYRRGRVILRRRAEFHRQFRDDGLGTGPPSRSRRRPKRSRRRGADRQ